MGVFINGILFVKVVRRSERNSSDIAPATKPVVSITVGNDINRYRYARHSWTPILISKPIRV